MVDLERFFQKIAIGDGCWEWQGSLSTNGYGQFFVENGSRQAHRISWEIKNGKIPDGLHVCHHCDNRKCVRPSHLFVGSRSDNMKDMVAKGRHNPQAKANACRNMLAVRKIYTGEKNHQSKLTEEDAMMIKAIPKKRGIATALSKKFGVSITVIAGIQDGTRWRFLPEPSATARQRAEAFLKTVGGWQ